MESQPLKALLHPFETGLLSWPERGESILFLNGTQRDELPPGTIIQQYFKPLSSGAVPDLPEGSFALVLLHAPHQIQDMRFMIAQGLRRLSEGGLFVCAAANDAGGKRIRREIEDLGLRAQEIVKHKSRIVFFTLENNVNTMLVDKWIEEGSYHITPETGFISCPGIFGWDKIDKGSSMLVQCLPESPGAIGADFGCGYGYLTVKTLTACPSIRKFYCLDADYRAIEATKRNLEQSRTADVTCLWEDLTTPVPTLPPLDFIVMNPPFHQGKESDFLVGKEFIKNAARSLNENGALWMVANVHLPYEDMLKDNFDSYEKIVEDMGFKVFHARR